ncbi:tetratricopeptide repeat protein [Sediminicola luteus]|uniref:Cell surface protein n=1 Tax=Sediminicola luteus TaxID=319238 RepID=A0ABV2TSK0_9FLAO
MKYLFLFVPLLFLFSCQNTEQSQVTNQKDYDKFLVSSPSRTTSKYYELWNSKIKPDSMQLTSFGIVAGEYNRYFQNTGDITYLKKAEQALVKAVEIAAIGKAGYQRDLARNYISQHRFREALQLAEAARLWGSGIEDTQSLLFDIHMELGNYPKAEKYLDSIKNMSQFGYLIRAAKWNDHKGDLDTTIRFMEMAKQKAEDSKNTGLMLWSYTNIADYYGHAGKIKDSYDYYLKSLQLDPNSAYAKKGIAWIVYSHENNPKEALRILDSVTKDYSAPDYYLLKSEIAAYQNNKLKSLSNLDKYYVAVQNPAYGDMYNVYNASLYLENTGQYEKAFKIAEKEVQNRPTPHSYDLLAYSYLKIGEKDKAMEVVEKHIDGKTFEPNILYHTAEIYKANGKMSKVNELKKELAGAAYELGPDMANKISKL